ncbi:LuxR C-terminal-related transcriptional regulator [Streptomyces canus]|uniref:LuxR C-terminal-related transcriptional regulator n=1 Tax=Streptomyces canus TaxID=58343 RepID=UPI003697D54F
MDATAEAVYRAMLKHPQMRLHEIANELEWSEVEVRRGLDELARNSLVRTSWEDPSEMRAVPPQVGLAALLESQERDLRARQEQFTASKLALERVVDEYIDEARQRPYEGLEPLVGIDAIRSKIEMLAASCTSEIMGFAPDGAQTEANRQASRPADQEALGRGILMRTVYLDSLMQNSDSLDYAVWLTEQGAEARSVPALPLRMVIYDRKCAIVPMDPENSGAGAVLLSGSGMVLALCALFEQTWMTARQIGRSRRSAVTGAADGNGPSRQEIAVLRLLADGCTDEAVARKLGLSVRTCRRIAANLLKQLHARSRFEAGVKAAMRGWLDDSAGAGPLSAAEIAEVEDATGSS